MKSIMSKLVVAALFATSLSAQASVVTEVEAFSLGRYDWDGTHLEDRTSVSIGEYGHANYFTFDLAGIDLTNVTGVKFVADHAWGELTDGYLSTYTIYDVITPVPTLIATNINQLYIFEDLKSGTVYGSKTYASAAETYNDFTVEFNAAGIQALKNANGGLFAFGGAYQSNDPLKNTVLFTDTEVGKLVFTYSVTAVPEADTSAMMLVGLLALGAVARRRN